VNLREKCPGIETPRRNSVPDPAFIVSVFDLAGLPVLYDKVAPGKPVHLFFSVPEERPQIGAPGPVLEALDGLRV